MLPDIVSACSERAKAFRTSSKPSGFLARPRGTCPGRCSCRQVCLQSRRKPVIAGSALLRSGVRESPKPADTHDEPPFLHENRTGTGRLGSSTPAVVPTESGGRLAGRSGSIGTGRRMPLALRPSGSKKLDLAGVQGFRVSGLADRSERYSVFSSRFLCGWGLC